VELQAALNPKLPVEPAGVVLRGVNADSQAAGNLFLGQARENAVANFDFAGGQLQGTAHARGKDMLQRPGAPNVSILRKTAAAGEFVAQFGARIVYTGGLDCRPGSMVGVKSGRAVFARMPETVEPLAIPSPDKSDDAKIAGYRRGVADAVRKDGAQHFEKPQYCTFPAGVLGFSRSVTIRCRCFSLRVDASRSAVSPPGNDAKAPIRCRLFTSI
jgi:hypothetical protein